MQDLRNTAVSWPRSLRAHRNLPSLGSCCLAKLIHKLLSVTCRNMWQEFLMSNERIENYKARITEEKKRLNEVPTTSSTAIMKDARGSGVSTLRNAATHNRTSEPTTFIDETGASFSRQCTQGDA